MSKIPYILFNTFYQLISISIYLVKTIFIIYFYFYHIFVVNVGDNKENAMNFFYSPTGVKRERETNTWGKIINEKRYSSETIVLHRYSND